MDVEGTAAAAMARRLRSARFAGTSRSQMLTPSEAEAYEDGYVRYSIRDEPLSDDVLAAGEAQDAAAEQVGCHEYDPDDRVLADELPPGYDPRIWGRF